MRTAVRPSSSQLGRIFGRWIAAELAAKDQSPAQLSLTISHGLVSSRLELETANVKGKGTAGQFSNVEDDFDTVELSHTYGARPCL